MSNHFWKECFLYELLSFCCGISTIDIACIWKFDSGKALRHFQDRYSIVFRNTFGHLIVLRRYHTKYLKTVYILLFPTDFNILTSRFIPDLLKIIINWNFFLTSLFFSKLWIQITNPSTYWYMVKIKTLVCHELHMFEICVYWSNLLLCAVLHWNLIDVDRKQKDIMGFTSV